MRLGIVLLAIAALIIAAAWNAGAVINTFAMLSVGPLFSAEAAWIGWLVIGLAISGLLVWLAARQGGRMADEDYDAEIKRQIERNQ